MSEFDGLSLAELEARRAMTGRVVDHDPGSCEFLRSKPFTWQHPWYESTAKYEFILAGNRCGKSKTLIDLMLIGLTGVKPAALGGKPIRSWPRGNCKHQLFLIASETEETLGRNLLPKLRRLVTPEMVEPRTNLHSTKKPWRFVSGAMLYFATYNQAPGAVEGSAWHQIGLDEPPPKEFFTALTRGGIDHSARVILAATPLKEPWILDDIILPSQDSGHPLFGKVDVFHAAMHDNCADCSPGDGFLAHEEIVTFLATLPPAERAAREFGKFASLIGLSFDYWDDKAHVVPDFDVPTRWPVVEVVDPAMKRGLYVMWFACDPDDQWFCIRAVHIDGDLGFAGMAAQIDSHRLAIGKQPDYAMMDARGGMHLANVDTRETWFDLFRRQKLVYEPAPAEMDQIATVHDWLKPQWKPEGFSVPRLRFVRKIAAVERGPIWGIKRFVWDPEQKKRRYDQPGKDWIDCMAYLTVAVTKRNLTYARYESGADRGSRTSRLAETYASGRRLLGIGSNQRVPWQSRKGGIASTYGQRSPEWTERVGRRY